MIGKVRLNIVMLLSGRINARMASMPPAKAKERMAPQRKLRIASTLMVVGIVPWILYLGWVAAILTSGRPGSPAFFMLDPIAMIGLMMMTFAGATMVAGVSACWSVSLTRRHAELRSRTDGILKIVVALALGVPLLWAIVEASR
jgi:fatty acid desaturase